MKKLFALLLALVMLLGCTAFAETAVDYTGVWVMTDAEVEGIRLSPEMLAMLGLSMTATLHGDGTAVLTLNENAENGSWALTANGVAITDEVGVTMDAVYQDETLVIEKDGMKMLMTREDADSAAPAEAAKEASALAGVDPAVFEGSWELTGVRMMGMEIPTAATGMFMEFTLAAGSGTITTQEDEREPVTEPVTYVVKEVEGAGTVLVISVANEEGWLAEEILSLNMMDADTLFFEMDEGGVSVSFVFTRKAE